MGVLLQLSGPEVLLVCVGIIAVSSQEVFDSNAAGEKNERSVFFLFQQPKFPKDCSDVLRLCSSSTINGVNLIKPVGAMKPFEVFCDNENDSGGWTVIQRRLEGSISFNRHWKQFKNGFGFLESEFWLGNDKLAYLTNQALYELHIGLVLSNRSYVYLKYNAFRISDEWSNYDLVSVGEYDGNVSSSLLVYPTIECPPNMVPGYCNCEATCSEPSTRNICDENCVEHARCVCADGFVKKGDRCVLTNECGCFLAEINDVIPHGDAYVNYDCSKKCTCQNNLLNCVSDYQCNANATCAELDGVRKCYCNQGYEGDGETCYVGSVYTDCFDAHEAGRNENGIYSILPVRWSGASFDVYCNMSIDNGGWTVIQRRQYDSTDFYRSWESYKHGFGSLDGDFWLGNEQLYHLTNQRKYRLRVDIVTAEGDNLYADYSLFRIGNHDAKYRLELGNYRGDAGDGMSLNNGGYFSTYDHDNDGCNNHNCAERHISAWWFNTGGELSTWCNGGCFYHYHHHNCSTSRFNNSCSTFCTYNNLNGDLKGGNGGNIFWRFSFYSHYCDIKYVDMKIRPIP